ncbi:MAG: transcriptional regulator [Candidatus Micrarchaeia archaeon]
MPLVYEAAANEVIPAIRSKLAKELMLKYKMKEKRVAEILGVAQAAISKYKSGKYSNKIKEIEAALDAAVVDKYAKFLAENGERYSKESMCAICQSYLSFSCKLNKIYA